MKTIYRITLGNQPVQVDMGQSHYEFRHRWDTLRHCHSVYELHILLDGHCQLEVEEQTIPLARGHGILIVPGEHHRPLNYDPDLYRFSLSFSTKSDSFIAALRQATPASRLFTATPQLLQLCKDIYYEYSAGNPFKQEQLQALLTQLMIHLLRQLSVTQTEEESSDNLTEQQRLSRIDTFFEKHFADSAGELALAQQLNLSRRQLDRVLKKHYGMNYRQKLIRTRMGHAGWYLRTFDMPISQIAQRVGYTSDSAFFQAFRQQYGITPREYRNNYTKKKKDG